MGKTTQCKKPKSLIIIGAGMAGIKVAYDCLKYDSDIEITILEANEYIGGRMKHFSFQGHTIELGANWISGLGTYGNPVWKLAKEVCLEGHIEDDHSRENCLAYDRLGIDVIDEYIESKDRFESINEKATEEVESRLITPCNDTDIRSFLNELGWEEQNLSAMDKVVEYTSLESSLVDGLDRSSVAHNFEKDINDVAMGQDEFFVEDNRGFSCILNGMVRIIKERHGKVQLSSVVKNIEYGCNGVKVTIYDIQSGDIKEIQADAAVCTVSLGVLQNGEISFSPPLPEWKVKALNELEMFLFSKVFIKIHDKLCKHIEKDYIIFCSDDKCHYPYWMRYRNVTEGNMFMCFVGGAEARRIESLKPEQIKDEVETLFRDAFKDHITHDMEEKIFRPHDVFVTDWSKNSRYFGSYSAFPVHAFSKIPFEDLTKPLTGNTSEHEETVTATLYFAGEAFDDKFNGWIQGAYRSGERVAKELLGIIDM